jgi:MYXO-CTERM domain-containing protein
VVLALVAMPAPAGAAERQCGTVTGVGLGDPISGGSLTIDGRTFDVGGLGTGNQLPPTTDPNALQVMFRVGVRACVEGDFTVQADGQVRLRNGRIFLDPTSLPNTSTDGAPSPFWLAALVALGVLVSLRVTQLGIRRR